ncbi:hypothetical protein OD91_1996 [Lutibacter sp. Hel_I_33_5]|uniref:hypothetical protein n=1 Tax=Lutibacter sp. Hel_I_33_5 TaxID=1566289 RepID=UPI0011A83FAD|nr:hypothetical protein [Lutibacter sp. Hel_I_33_5]TVZ56699.1 hypothetical protein OD91_1996 [Lutibacter sp. Hel_I_33_5]
MKIKMLPNWGKKIGLSLFFIGFFVVFTAVNSRKSLCEGYNSHNTNTTEIIDLEPVFIEKWFGESAVHLFEVLTILGLLIYMLSKEKIEDDYINKLRLESYQLTSIIVLVLSLGIYALSENLKLSIDTFATLFLMSYLIIFALKKRVY